MRKYTKRTSAPEKEQNPTFVGIKEACKILGCCRGTLNTLYTSGKLPYYKPTAHPLFKVSELNAYIESTKVM